MNNDYILPYLSELSTAGVVLHVVDSNKDNAIFCNNIKFFLPDYNVISILDYDCDFYDNAEPSSDVLLKKISALNRLIDCDTGTIIVITLGALFRYNIPKDLLISLRKTLHSGMVLDVYDFVRHLSGMGYVRMQVAESIGQFAVRGDVVDIAIGISDGCRINFCEDEIENIKLFNLGDQLSFSHCDNITVLPATEIIVNDFAMSTFAGKYRQFFGDKMEYAYEAAIAGLPSAPYSRFFTLFSDKKCDLFSYFPSDLQMICDVNLALKITNLTKAINEQYNFMLQQNDIILPPSELFLTAEKIHELLTKIPLLKITGLS